MKVGSLFSGAGLGDLGLEWAGFHHAWFCETDDYARRVLALRWPGVPVYGDIREVDFTQVEPVDLLAGGFPCQDISVAGKGAGITGERSGLWKEFARAISEIRPRYALIENSPALVNRGLDVVLSDLAALGYDAEWHCIPASTFGAPHKRDRVWIVAYPAGDCRDIRHELGSDRRENEAEQAGVGCSGKEMADTAQLFCNGGYNHGENRREIPKPRNRNGKAGQVYSWWATEPGLGRVVDGCPDRVAKLRCLGNGQVPHCTYFIGRLIQEHAGGQA